MDKIVMNSNALLGSYKTLLAEINSLPDRDSKNQALAKLTGEIQHKICDAAGTTEFETKLLALYEEEWDHQFIVCTALRKLNNKRRHDWSKDPYYIFILAGKFAFRLQSEDFERQFQAEVNRHYMLEAHHPQHTQHGGVIQRLDVEECAIDQLSRNLVRHGKVDEETMGKYLPRYEDPQHLTWFKEYCAQHTELMKQIHSDYMQDENVAKVRGQR